jgi:nicotinate-nucleotide adenylyltransferase
LTNAVPSAGQRLGVFGGAFDPPHVAHVSLAQAALEQLQLDQLRIFPTGQAWHRPRAMSAPEHRLAMTRLAFGDLPRTVIDELFLVMGEDQAVSLTRWREWEAILDLAVICMAARLSAQTSAGAAQPALPARAKLRLLRLPNMPESATEVRERAAAGTGFAHLVPPPVASYIDQHRLYRFI